MNLSPQAKRVLRLAVDNLNDLPLEERHELWTGIADLTPEDTELGGVARMNAELTFQVIHRQQTFLALLADENKEEPQ